MPNLQGGAQDARPDLMTETAAQRIAAKARAGDHQAFDQLVRHYQGRLFGLTLMMLRDPHGAEEVTQDAFIRAFRNLDLYDPCRSFYPWLATIAVRLAQNWLRRRALTLKRESAVTPGAGEPTSPGDPFQELIQEEDARRLWRSVAALPSGERTATFLYYRQEMKVGDIAGALGVTNGTVKTLLFRARAKLRKNLTLDGGERVQHEEPSK